MPVSRAQSSNARSAAAAVSAKERSDPLLSKSLAHLRHFKMQQMQDAEDLLINKLPERMQELDELLNRPEFNIDFTECRSEVNISRPSPQTELDGPSTKKRKLENSVESTLEPSIDGSRVVLFPDGNVNLNKTITNLFTLIKPLILKHMEDCDLLKMWIEFLIPKVEDGNNFGVDIQEECRKEVNAAEAEAALYLDHASRYYLSRGKMIVKIAKYPHVEDYRKIIDEIDEKQYMNMKLVVRELFNNYATIHDMLTKNLEKIKRPRTTNAENLY